MILLCGIPSESAMAMVRRRLEAMGEEVEVFAQRAVARIHVEMEVRAGRVGGALSLDGRTVALDSVRAVYLRLMEDAHVPEVAAEPPGSPLRRHSQLVHEVLLRWIDVTPARVVNRPSVQGSNGSKPFQAQLIAGQGLEVPETLVTNDPELVREFVSRHRDVVYKSMSGVRSIVQRLEPPDLDRLEAIRWCPVQFQERVPGVDVRVHTVGGEAFATAVHSDATDYRYARQQVGTAAELAAVELPAEITLRCLSLAEALELEFAGIDLRIAPDGRVYCFEVNPSPAFSYYEANTGQPISAALARHLAAA